MPLEFLRRKGGGAQAPKGVVPEPTPPPAVPEEAVAEEHQLRLTYGAKTSNGVRMQGGPQLLGALPRMLDGVSKTPVEVVEPRATTLASAAPNIIRTAEATEWLRAHGENNPITATGGIYGDRASPSSPPTDRCVAGYTTGRGIRPGTPSMRRSSAAWPRTGMSRPAT